MKVVGMIPYWMEYQSKNEGDNNRNALKLGGHHPLNYSINSLNLTKGIDQVVVYCSDENVLTFIDEGLAVDLMPRPKFLDADEIAIEDIIDEFLRASDADVVVMLHPNSPFLRSSTISDCLDKVVSGVNDSAFTAYEFKKLTWYQGAPLNYSLKLSTPQLKDLSPVTFEQSSLYIFTRNAYLENRKRVGLNPYVKIINHFEGHEINVKEDFQIAELIVNSGMFSEY